MSENGISDKSHKLIQEGYRELESLNSISYDEVVKLLTDENSYYQIKYYIKTQQYFNQDTMKSKKYSLVSIVKDQNKSKRKVYLSEDEDAFDIYAKLISALRKKTNPSFQIYKDSERKSGLMCYVGNNVLIFPKEIMKSFLYSISDNARPGDIVCWDGENWNFYSSNLKGHQKTIERGQKQK